MKVEIEDPRVTNGFLSASIKVRGERFSMRELALRQAEEVREAPEKDKGVLALVLALELGDANQFNVGSRAEAIEAIRDFPSSVVEALNELFVFVQGREDELGN